MLRDLRDTWGWIQQIIRRIERLESGAQLGNSSITKGRMRFIGGTLRVDSGGRVEIVGYLQVEGTTSITGPVTISGNLDVTGSSKFTGPLSIEGATSITGQLTVAGPSTFTGTLTIKGATTIEGETQITGELTVDGPWEMNGNGTISGDVIVDGDMRIMSPGHFRVGNTLYIDPAHSSSGAQLEFGTTRGSNIFGDNATIGLFHPAGADTASVVVGQQGLFNGVSMLGKVRFGTDPGPMPSNVTGKYMILGNDGIVYTGSAGGGGDPGTPPSGNPNGYIWPADPGTYGISDDYAAHVARGSAEPGVDVMTPVGAPLWAPGPGTVTAVQTSSAGATGRYVTFVTDAGDWFRFLHNSSIVVSAGQHVEQAQLLAYTGGSGFGSEAYYGPHTHISFKVGYTGAFPGAGALDDFEAYMAAQG